MFPEVTGFIRYINDVIKMIPEVSNDEVLRSAEKYHKERMMAQALDI